ncbi:MULTISPECIES: transcriptional regulator [Lysinibacillus]|jgi:predicted DNA-binding transcriptional regulator YafY|uniref:transcriptional regulator n=1 Tax=Lysinibacillus TaxID=400634 RepID=UPI0004D7DA3A|nr:MULTISPECIES: transcriptional regulator [Lysinibacillus]AJK87546.1 transcriptional regulator [Lysinibacillus fusiformis]KGA80734.1 transcriptional regulator [Lysinibacillus fusiformis]KHK53045.1 transcriptional regulator [Lysinibacillus sp. A1]MCE4044041.1 transcriptional regulator [Lysinibacillus fusiformis]MCK1989160.1 transcriptional regulator [Lysinibacillus fusiformis]
MREQLIKAMQRNQLVDIMYIAKNGSVTKRRVRVIKIVGDSFQAFCFTRQAKRSFITKNVLAVTPVFRKEREVV